LSQGSNHSGDASKNGKAAAKGESKDDKKKNAK